MNRSRMLIMMATSVLCLGFALNASDALAQQEMLKQQLIGTWVLVSNDDVAADGTRKQLFGPSPKGILIFEANGRFAQIQLNPNRPKFKASTRLDGTPEENKAVVQGTSALFGTWSADEADKALILHTEFSMFPNFDGTDSKRSVKLTGDRLQYTNPTASGGGTAEAVYQRVR
jgi:lipocalin-like protein